MSKFKTRIERLEKKAGTKIKKGMILSIIRMKRAIAAYRRKPDGSKEILKGLTGFSPEDLKTSLKRYKETEVKPISRMTDEELDREIERTQERLNELKGVT